MGTAPVLMDALVDGVIDLQNLGERSELSTEVFSIQIPSTLPQPSLW